MRVCSTARISRPTTSARKSRVLKVELQSVADRNILFHSAKYFKDDPITSAIFIMLWLLPDELSKLKEMQNRCRLLYNKSPSLKNGKN